MFFPSWKTKIRHFFMYAFNKSCVTWADKWKFCFSIFIHVLFSSDSYQNTGVDTQRGPRKNACDNFSRIFFLSTPNCVIKVFLLEGVMPRRFAQRPPIKKSLGSLIYGLTALWHYGYTVAPCLYVDICCFPP